MILTDSKIVVTHQMMQNNNMSRGIQYAIPKDLNDLSKGLVWKDLFTMTDHDFDKIEEYFLTKTK